MIKKLLVALAVAFAAACGDPSGAGKRPLPPPLPPAPTVPATVNVTADSTSITAGRTLQLRAQALTAANVVMEGQVFTWQSNANGVATVSASGLVTAVAPGSATFTATTGSVSGTYTLTVKPVPVASLAIVPAADSLQVASSRQLNAEVRAADGTLLTGRTITWSTSDATVLSVTPAGLAAGVAAGQVQVTATSEGKTATATIKVLARPVSRIRAEHEYAVVLAGSSLRLRATAVDAVGATVPNPSLRWTSNNLQVARVADDGTLTGVARGEARITISAGNILTTVFVSVYPAAAAGQGILQVTSEAPAVQVPEWLPPRILFIAEGGGLQNPPAVLAGLSGGGWRLTSAVAQIAVPGGGSYRVRVMSQDGRYDLERIVGGAGMVTGQTVAAGEVKEVTVPLAVPVLQLTGPASVTGGEMATFNWSVAAPGLSMRQSLQAGFILEPQNTSTSRFPFGGQLTRTNAAFSNGAYTASHTFQTSQTPGVFKVRAFVEDTWTILLPDGRLLAETWSAFGALSAHQLLEIR